ncbi:GNAT family N-acetyltransferase [Streptomyces sp. 549]|uniref:GNAT family N-acetyltransferase n=1 Tax=Streptomyces sp. 549 TaxID=3049076 RepID=UPI0024C2E1AC|nr:GNAT family N-acetyltransferase [Streptomyces sp. 549]MDK1474838.1 GNAT family N-acetyltransferase [Streptomyces sp. 549]
MDQTRYALRPAAPEDAGFLTDMLLEAVNWQPGRTPMTREQALDEPLIAHYISGWPLPGDLGLVAETPGPDGTPRPAGAAWMRLFPAADAGYGFVAEDIPELTLAVAPGQRGRGLGRALLRALGAQAAAAGHSQLSLSVERANRAAKLYAAEGYTTVASGPVSDTMVKDLG